MPDGVPGVSVVVEGVMTSGASTKIGGGTLERVDDAGSGVTGKRSDIMDCSWHLSLR